jgi:hypothetical protein
VDEQGTFPMITSALAGDKRVTSAAQAS